MESTIVQIKQSDGYQTRLFCYTTSREPVLGTVLLLHGMAEHHGRYLEFIHLLTKEGFDVYAYDHRGHGTDKKLSDLGFFASKRGASLVVEDAITICNYIKEQGRSDKLAVFGHSMGSLILRCLMQQYHGLTCAVVSSTTMPPLSVSNTGLLLAGLLCLFQGPKKQSKFLDKLLFGNKAYSSLCSRTTFDWLTRNNTVVGNYISDPYCGFVCTTSFYRDLIQLTRRAAVKRNIAKARKELPVYFLAGSKDPVGSYSKDVIKLQHTFEKLGFTSTCTTIYEDARHELLNELNAAEVMQDITVFLHKQLG